MMAKEYEHSDASVVVVIGSGAGGGTISNELAQKGIDVVCLEAGSRLTLADVVNHPGVMDAKMGWHDERDGAFVWVCKTVGGTTMRWSGVAPRLEEFELRALSMYGQLDDNTTLIDWPITPAELAPFYDRAESKLGVSGTHGIADSEETNNYKVFAAGAKLAGYNNVSSKRMAINSVARDGRPGCQQIGFCYSGCAIGAKWSTLYTEIPKAEATGHFELRANSMAVRIEHDASGKVTGIVYTDAQGNLQEQKTRAVCVAGNVVETARILLNSESALFPQGLANSSDQVGRNYMRHTFGAAIAVMPHAVNLHRGARQTGILYDEHRHDEQRGFAGGYQLQAIAFDPHTVSSTIGGWGSEHADFMENYTNLAALFISGEDPPEKNNRISLHPNRTDASGLPVPVIEYRNHKNTNSMRDHAIASSKRIYESLGAKHFWGGDASVGCHNMGVARMSKNPNDGVTNRWGQAHDVSNLFISDGSVFSTSGAGNPTLTIVALAIRQAEHIADRMNKKSL